MKTVVNELAPLKGYDGMSPVGLANSRTMHTSTPNNQPNALHHFYSRAAFRRHAVIDRFDNECQSIATFPPMSTPVVGSTKLYRSNNSPTLILDKLDLWIVQSETRNICF